MEKTKKPIIGILSQNLNKSAITKKYPHLKKKPYIAASYEKYLESVNVEVLLINCDINEDTARKIYNSVHALLLPGGNASLVSSNYARIAKLFFNWSIEDTDNSNRYFPIFGICLGFQFLLRQFEEVENCLGSTKTLDVNLPIKFSVNPIDESNLFANATKELIDVLSSEDVTFNYHKYSLKVNELEKHPRIEENYKILATSVDPNNQTEFVAAIEGKKYPFFGLEWHPEKNSHEIHPEICHSENSIACSLHFAKFFREECCRDNYEPTENFEHFVLPVKLFDTADVLKMKEVYVFVDNEFEGY